MRQIFNMKSILIILFLHSVIPTRLELATVRSGGGCSIQLSYGTKSHRRLHRKKLILISLCILNHFRVNVTEPLPTVADNVSLSLFIETLTE